MLAQVLGQPGIEFDARKLPWVGVPSREVCVCALTKASGVTSAAAWMAATKPVKLAVDVKQNDTREDYVRALITRGPDGGLIVEPHKIQDSSMLSVLAWSNALLVRPAHDPARKAGDIVQVIAFADVPGGY